jgi:nicotinamide mononucleotide transporter
VSFAPPLERAWVAAVAVIATGGLAFWFERIGDAAPALDALTTVLSLVAQWLLNRKRIENWFVWIAADLLYVWLYVARGLHLTAALYAIFVVMCVAGLRRWRTAARTPASRGAPLGRLETGPA